MDGFLAEFLTWEILSHVATGIVAWAGGALMIWLPKWRRKRYLRPRAEAAYMKPRIVCEPETLMFMTFRLGLG